jgi:Glycosyl transferases group 1
MPNLLQTDPKVLVSWYTNPRYIAPFILSPRQVVVGPMLRPDQPRSAFAGWTPTGRYDLFEELKKQRIGTRYDLLVVFADASGTNLPVNLKAFDCPKVLCVGDTHHLDRPLRKMLDYAAEGGFDYIVSSYNRQHLRWFRLAGFERLAWLPGLPTPRVKSSRAARPRHEIAFVGQVGRFHPRRSRMIEGLQDAGLPIKVVRAPIATAASAYSEAAVSFNCSLNGDLNLRIFEVLACGGCLLTDKLSDAAGLELLLQEGAHYFSYGTIDEAVERASFLLSNPDAAHGVALAGQRLYKASLHPGHMARRLLEWIAQAKLEARFSVPPEAPVARMAIQSRLACYEQLQELQKHFERARVLMYGKIDQAILNDVCDLHRLELHFADEQDAPDDGEGAASPRALSDGSWDCIVKPKHLPLPPGLRSAIVQEV